MAWEDDLNETLQNLNRNMSRIFGTGDAFLNRRQTTNTANKGTLGQFEKHVRNATEGLRLLHGSTNDLGYAFKRMVGFTAVGEAFHLLIEGARELVGTYSKLTDIGQHFGGSMFEMARQAGESGLSLDEFARAVENHGTTMAVLQRSQIGTTSAFNDLQKGVRNSLKDFGFYGMTLTQVTDTTFDYMDTLRQTGALERMTTFQRIEATRRLVESATGFSAAFGTSREQILKTTNEVMRDPQLTAWLADQSNEVQSRVSQVLAAVSAIPGEGGKLMAEGLGKSLSSVLGSATSNSPLTKALIDTGFGGILEPLRTAGVNEVPRVLHDIYTQLDSQRDNLRALAETDPQAALVLQVTNSLRGLLGSSEQYNKFLKSYAEGIAKQNDPITKAILTFESTFHEITGAFRDNLYRGIAETMLGPNKDLQAFQTHLGNVSENLKKLFTKLGNSLGKLLNWVLEPDHLAAIGNAFEKFTDLLVIVIPAMLGIANALGSFLIAVKDGIKAFTGMGDVGALIVTGILAWLAKRAISGAMTLLAQRVIVVGGNALGNIGGRIGAAAETGAGAAAGGGFLSRAFGIGSKVIGIGSKVIGKGLLYGAIAILLDSVVGLFRNFLGNAITDFVQGFINGGAAGATIGSVVPILGTFWGAIVGGVIGGLVNLVGLDKIESMVDKALSSIGNTIKAIWNYVWDGFANKIREYAPDWLTKRILDTPTTTDPTRLRSEITAPVEDKDIGQRITDLKELLKQDNAQKDAGDTSPGVLDEIKRLTEQIRDLTAHQTSIQKKTYDKFSDNLGIAAQPIF